ncbi:MAG TPA: DUF2613 family protein [Jiangellaceae bacterium]|nr:DUF2613 family protein [Jiangellaceae bacterium]
MSNVLAGIVAAFIGGALAAAAVFTLVGVSSGPSPEEVASDRQVESVNVLVYGER